RMTLDGKILARTSFDIAVDGLEGITSDAEGRHLYLAREDNNELIKFDIGRGREVARCPIAEMNGFAAVDSFFAGTPDNKGLEGIAWNATSSSLFVLKEGVPGMLIEIASDLTAILGRSILSADRGFVDPGLDADSIDYSGICYDPTRDAFWIVSDKARRVYILDRQTDRVLHSAPLGFGDAGEYAEIEKAEGVVYDPDKSRLYVVSDKEARLYVFDVRP
ncbi:MAG: SdiA-regulated domain-containing protein, partial [Pseudomonadota bacterium]